MQVDRVEASPEKIAEYRALLAKKEAREREIAAKAPPRPRPWHKIARPEQLVPADNKAQIHLYLAGRGWGKSATGSNWIAEQAARHPNTDWAIVAPTWRNCRIYCIKGPSGVLKALLPGELASLNESDLTVRLTNGSTIYGFPAEAPDRLRGANLSGAWVDELATIGHAEDFWGTALMPALRIGERPQVVITTTPRPTALLKELLKRDDGSVRVIRGRTKDNEANLSAIAVKELYAQYGGTRAGRQELDGEMIEDLEGALWSRSNLDQSRVLKIDDVPQLARIVVGVDPAVTSGDKSDNTGIVVAGRSADGHFYVLENATMKGTPHACMRRAVKAFHTWKADRIVAEKNNGGDYIESVLRTVDQTVPYSTVNATRGKRVRAEPTSALWEQGRGHIVGVMPELEDQMCSFTPDSKDSPDDMDAMVWSIAELNEGTSAMVFLASIAKMCDNCTRPNKKVATHCKHCGSELSSAA